MATESELLARSAGQCELCKASEGLSVYSVPASEGRGEAGVIICATCVQNIETNVADMSLDHWRCLSDSMWSTVPAVQVLAWRILKRVSAQSWAQDLLDMLYLDEFSLEWAEAGMGSFQDDVVQALDSNGALLKSGDNVTIIKDLNVKGMSFVAKRGTVVRGISLTDNPEHIEGRVNGTRIVILCCYVKKS